MADNIPKQQFSECTFLDKILCRHIFHSVQYYILSVLYIGCTHRASSSALFVSFVPAAAAPLRT